MKSLLSSGLFALTLAALAAKPAALVVSDPTYSPSDANAAINRVFHPARTAYRRLSEMPPPDQYENYASIWVFAQAKPLTDAGMAALKKYVENGGLLVVTGGAVRSLTGAKFAKAGFPGYKIIRMNREPKRVYGVVKADHPLLAGMDLKQTPKWFQTSRYVAEPLEGTSIIVGDDKNGLITETVFGKGRIVWLWDCYQFIGKQDGANLPSLDQVMKNTMKLVKHADFAEDLAAVCPGKDLLIWQRQWQRWPQERPHFEPNFPRKGEEVAKLEFFSAVGERDTRFFVIQSPKRMDVSISFQGKPFTLLKMSKAEPMLKKLRKGQPKELAYAEGNYYLRKAPGKITLEPGVPEVFALRADSYGLKPGKYTAELRFGSRKIPVAMQVYPVTLEKSRPVTYRTWGLTLPVNPAGAAMLNLHNIIQGGMPTIRTIDFTVKATGETIPVALKKHPELFQGGKMPEMIIPENYRKEALAMARYGITCAQMIPRPSVDSMVITATKAQKNLPKAKWTPEMCSLYQGFYKQLADFYYERGVSEIIIMGFNEPNRDVIRAQVLPLARLFSPIGVKVGASWTAGTFRELELVKQIAPYVYWSCYTVVAPQLQELLEAKKIPLPADTRCGYYIGSTPETRRPAEYGRSYGRYFFSLSRDFTCAHAGPFWKEWLYYDDNPSYGVTGQRLFAWANQEQTELLNCAFVEGIRDGLDDSNLFWILRYYQDELRKVKAADAQGAVSRIEAAKKRWIDEIGFIKAKRGNPNAPYEYVKISRDMPTARAELFKKEILDELALLRPVVRKYLKPVITCYGMDLSGGAEISGGTLDGVVNRKGAPVKITLGTDKSVAAGDFRILRDPAKKTVRVIAGDAEALKLGIRALERNIIHTGDWLMF